MESESGAGRVGDVRAWLRGLEVFAGPPADFDPFSWPLQGRQVCVRGTVQAASSQQSAADLPARSLSARAEVLLGRQCGHLAGTEERERALREAPARLASDRALVSPGWTLYTLVPVHVGFWQADRGRPHNRLRYGRPDAASRWQRRLLWP